MILYKWLHPADSVLTLSILDYPAQCCHRSQQRGQEGMAHISFAIKWKVVVQYVNTSRPLLHRCFCSPFLDFFFLAYLAQVCVYIPDCVAMKILLEALLDLS